MTALAFTPILMLLLLVASLPTSLSQDPITPGPTVSDCSPRLVAFMPCAPFVQGNAPRPAQSCCDNLNQLYGLQPGCLCLLLNDTTLSAFPINRTLALQLPVLCKLQANSSSCSGTIQIFELIILHSRRYLTNWLDIFFKGCLTLRVHLVLKFL
ncbi:hypothetical protein PVK06_027193 [Gossypium arboreum]|uniref:Bifunctional inhibitor/plant lipid transfer protein/seed storage helical domain-containing protein n=1 Tax=Gossypium arboreum TaxID=29729 RepID=A0ABR0NZL8_GOSAR|nr:hypothetical protein PVK06_027193 [Gossypium arboreum]